MKESEKKYARIIVNIAVETLDRPFEYRIPEALRSVLEEGMEVTIPFGKANTERKGYVVAITDTAEYDEALLKDILRINEKSVGMEGRTLQLAAWMRHTYGGTMITAMRTVLPVKKKIKESTFRTICRVAETEALQEQIDSLNPVRYAGRIRLYEALLAAESIPEQMVKDKLQVSASVLKTAEKDGFIRIETTRQYRAPRARVQETAREMKLSAVQQSVVEEIREEMQQEHPRPALIHGITGSGKTEVYMELIAGVLAEGKQAIVLIPEIALTFQTLMRFYTRFGDRVSVLHSKLSDGERFDQYERAKNGELDIIIGPRSVLFIPFPKVGIIIIDEEHETSYKSEKVPKYHAREVAEYIAARDHAQLVLGSATPSLEAYYRAKNGQYRLCSLQERFGGARLPQVHIVDLREELKHGNRSFFSDKLKSLLTERMVRGEQSMLFINRRGTAGFVSCRTCGFVVKCPHCDVSLTQHRDGRLRCHYCGHEEETPKLCPKCGSKYIAGFRAGTERIEEELQKLYPSARVMRMDADTTKNKDDYERILSAFADGEADILVGTQMIVKGHDFPNVTLVGAIAADLSLHASDFHATERTFQLLAQAAGRAGRGQKRGEVVIQTYMPEHYSIVHAAAHDYEAFYEEEIGFRELADYPPVCHMLAMQFYATNETAGIARAGQVAEILRGDPRFEGVQVLGPAEALIGKLKDIYRTGLYLRSKDTELLIAAKDLVEAMQEEQRGTSDVIIQFDMDPTGAF
ncbi:MAG: primosomal protein N' [Lachnospiraceae bacterium]|nr:primosomal protein N' [Lachnospiraceae bacterium]